MAAIPVFSLAIGGALAFAPSDLRAQDLFWRRYGPNLADRMGYRVARIGDVDGDGFDDVATAISESDQNGKNCGAVRCFSGHDGSAIWTVYGGGADDIFGAGLGACGDVDGDGFPEVVAGALQANGKGYVELLSGATGALIGTQQMGDSQHDRLGVAADGVGDVDGDGVPDYAAGAPEDDNTAAESGSVRLFSGATGAILRTVDGPARAFANFGTSVAGLGDVDGDGSPDFVGGELGAIDVVQGSTGNNIYTRYGDPNNPNDLFGVAVANLGDLDQDGVNDFIVGAPQGFPVGGGEGIAYVYSGATGTLLFEKGALMGTDFFGISVGGCGDANGDGTPDFVVGAIPNRPNLSYVALFSGHDGRLLYQFFAKEQDDELGIACGGAGDADGDGFADVLLGARGDFHGQGQEGSITVRLGNDLWLQSVPRIAFAGTTEAIEIRGGPPSMLAGLFLVELNGTPMFVPFTFLTLDGFGEGSFGGVVPPGLAGIDCLFRAYAARPGGGKPLASHDELLLLR